ncbi:MAG TPA: M23 family metallopeptidase [Longimicrobiales bacterium]|nr:M23 family metallopeptidase [Longimicrobiales bacterium]
MSARATITLTLLATTAACGIPRWPVDARVTSDFGLRMRGWSPDMHRGVDLDVPSGTPVRAMAEARVRFAGVMSGFGNVVWLDHGGGTLSVYAHLSTIQAREDEHVRGGQVIGLSGASGNATTPHLHFEVWRWGREVDPVPLLGGLPRGR